MRLSDLKGRKSLEILADMVDPAEAIISDAEIAKAWKTDGNKLTLAKLIVKKHVDEIFQILALINDTTVEAYDEKSFTEILADTMDIIGDEELITFFKSLGEKVESISSGSATGKQE